MAPEGGRTLPSKTIDAKVKIIFTTTIAMLCYYLSYLRYTPPQIWQELVMTIGDDPEDTGWRAWSSSKLKVILLASKERESRSNIANLQEVHEQEVDSYGPGLCLFWPSSGLKPRLSMFRHQNAESLGLRLAILKKLHVLANQNAP